MDQREEAELVELYATLSELTKAVGAASIRELEIALEEGSLEFERDPDEPDTQIAVELQKAYANAVELLKRIPRRTAHASFDSSASPAD